ncbi:hypothetical protein GLOTRDRAFT_120272 [Gloeophyllum trabeum ATCC 11539]|uniref:Uncharacterized protein n=1 Tax=Gloeophyllum trabeum (strain ATCC 11539 / FP-39264 / Madison 617) TaxID=670483 RepID=S7QHA1_GLOTA|nr:uncharacterized protein GLOTRDRAFT_120272 [Gloeophyllum trabeum ATCC 11539]EPQ58638.1 hypothetical protein GLOTRDRAFT_120272 [Gloeophyllum trabeum ATCC 11539]
MTAVMQPSSSPFMSPAFRPGHGILLNPSPRTTAFPLPTPTPTPLPHPASYTSLSSSSSSAATDEDALYSSSTDVDAHPARTHRSRSLPAPHSAPARKIRFAPLPDPRRAVFVTDGGDELPIPLSDDDGMIVSSAASVSGDSNNTKKFTIGMDSRSPSVSPQVHASTNSDWELVDSPRINSYKLPPPALAPESHPPSLASSISSHANYEYTTSPAPSMPSSPTNASCFPGALPSSGKRGLTSKLLRPFTISKKPSLSFSNTSTESVGLPRQHNPRNQPTPPLPRRPSVPPHSPSAALSHVPSH